MTDDDLTVTTAQQYRALGHPVRHRLLFALGQEPATLSGLAADLGLSKGSVGHHLKILREAGLVRLDHTRRVRGGTEQYFKRAAQRLRYDTGSETTKAALSAVADEIIAGEPDPLLLLRNVRLSESQARRLRELLEETVHGLADEEDEPRYGVLVGLYRPGQSGAKRALSLVRQRQKLQRRPSGPSFNLSEVSFTLVERGGPEAWSGKRSRCS